MARILVADDAAIMRKNLRMILIQAGHTVVAEAADGAEACEEYSKHLPDLVTLDINMPVVNGMDAMKKILKEYPDAKIIIISSANNNHIILEAIQSGAKNYIMKPFMVEKVINVVNQVLQVSDRVNSDTVQKIYRNMEEGRSHFSSVTLASNGGLGIPKSPELFAVPPEDRLKAPSPQFSVELRSNTFIVNIDETIDSENFSKLYSAMQGFLLVKPLRIILNLQNSGYICDEYLEKLVEYMNQVKYSEGSISVVAQKEDTLQFFKNKGIGWFANFYTHISQVRFF